MRTAAALLGGAPPLAAYALAAVAATAVTITRPTQAALVPALARTPDELTATNVVSGWIESVSVLVAPALAGVLLAVASPGWVFAVMAVVAGASALLVGPAARAGAARRRAARARRRRSPASALLAREPAARVLVGLLGAQFVAIGALDVLYVVLAISVLDLGGSGAGYLNAAFGAGGVAGIAVTVALVGRRRLLPPLVARRRSSGARPSSLLAAWPTRRRRAAAARGRRGGAVAARRRRPDDCCSGRPRPTCSHASSACSKGSRWPRSRSARC